jgi:molybdopterin/thiamine biosynthesis adenylyltransferase
MKKMHDPAPRATPAAASAAAKFRKRRILQIGLGNIGSHLASLITPLAESLQLVDRDIIEPHNVANQFFGPHHAGRTKVEVTADRIERLAPHLKVGRHVVDLEDLPWEEFAHADVVLGCLDSLRARQILSEKTQALQIPYIDGAVGEPLLVRTQVLLAGQACLECSWGDGEYRQLTTEFPCRPGAAVATPRTAAPACCGAATAAVMVAQYLRLFGQDPPRHSYEINGDLAAAQFRCSARRRNSRCRSPHEPAPRRVRLKRPFDQATVADIVAAVSETACCVPIQFEFRRNVLDGGLFGSERFASPEQLVSLGHCSLHEFGLTAKDRVVARGSGQTQATHICLHPTPGGMP